VVHGPQTAIVVGKSGEDIWTDKYGRVKLQFHWDREGQSDENSSCWVRVSQAWAGSNWHGGEAALADLCADNAFHAHMAEVIKRVNDGLSPIERVRRFILTADPFTVDNGQMTPTMKLRRHVLKEKYGERLEALYH